ncbi:hypothetical protein ZEAMMB73_Zm00001d043484 [Zea mays]|uniref:Uncharacterized protein n=1 Tax=Zea mays TaxID=4577 RepID=A0A1D6NCI2_MAIZE|nr:hypothetical protein ZEAMMB73_Zm00001d043484 [Zea mays]
MEPPSLRPRPPWPRHRRRICAFPRPRPPPSPPPTPSPPSASSPPSSALPAHCNRLLTMLAWDGDGDAAIRGLCPLRRLQHLLCHRHLHPWRGMFVAGQFSGRASVSVFGYATQSDLKYVKNIDY